MLNQIAAIHGTGTPVSTTSYESIATTNPTTGQSISFTSIPSTYKHLQVRFIARTSLSATAFAAASITFNNDTSTSNYAYHRLFGANIAGTQAAYSGGDPSPTLAYVAGAAAANNLANEFAAGVIDVFDYQNTNKNKTVRSLWGGDDNTNGAFGQIHLNSGLWMSTTAINRLDISLGSGQNYVTGSQFALYGIKG